MNCYRVSKYNPLYRKNGVYTRDEWTSYSDIGKIYGGKVFAADCLREKCWGKLTARGFVWKTGYDFYMYFACDLMPQTISDIAKKYGLYTDKCEYNNG